MDNSIKKGGFSFKCKDISFARPVLMSVAIIWIILFHSEIQAPESTILRAVWYVFFSFGGGIGVDIFLIVSGFGLVFSHFKKNVYKSCNNLFRFYLKRFLKVLMPYTVAFLLWYLSFHIKDGSLGDFFSKYTIYELFTTGFRRFWYIHAIVILYLLFPIFVWLFDKIKYHFAFIGLMAFFVILNILLSFFSKSYLNYEVFTSRIPAFISGIYLGYLAKNDIKLNKPLTIAIVISMFLFLFGLLALVRIELPTFVDRYIYIIYSLIFVMGTSFLSTFIGKKVMKIFIIFGASTLNMYLLHLYMNEVLSLLNLNIWIRLILNLIITISLSIAIDQLIRFIKTKMKKVST